MRETNWFFTWIGGGYNTVMAKSLNDAIEKATKLGKPTRIWRGAVPNVKSFVKDPDQKRTNQENEKYSSLFI